MLKAFYYLATGVKGLFMTEEDVKIAWGALVSHSFKCELMAISRRFGWSKKHADWLMACMAFESAETFDPGIKNFAGSGATGLIQFMPATARGLGTDVDELAEMTPVEQLRFVEKYFAPYARRIHSLSDMYLAILYPRYVGSPAETVMFFDGSTAYRQNSGLDANDDGKITKAEAAAKVFSKLERGLEPGRLG